MGKDKKTGSVAMWSLITIAPFHAVNMLLSHLKHYIEKKRGRDAANLVSPNLWVGNLFSQDTADLKGIKFRAVVDMTCEHTERCSYEYYLNLPIHDGNPPSTLQMLEAIAFVKHHIPHGNVLIHCAYGIGRSACVASAVLFGLGRRLGPLEGFAVVKAGRPQCRLNSRMKMALLNFERYVRTGGERNSDSEENSKKQS